MDDALGVNDTVRRAAGPNVKRHWVVDSVWCRSTLEVVLSVRLVTERETISAWEPQWQARRLWVWFPRSCGSFDVEAGERDPSHVGHFGPRKWLPFDRDRQLVHLLALVWCRRELSSYLEYVVGVNANGFKLDNRVLTLS
jgi:hypothetical protein